MMTPGLEKIRNVRGTALKIAKGLRISAAAVSKWDRVPAERVIAVEAITAIPRGELRPDLYPDD